MFNLKPSKDYPKMSSEQKVIFKNKKGYWTLREYYGDMRYLSFDYWEYTFEYDHLPEMAVWKRQIHIPLNWRAFYIQFTYRHLGKCHKDLRSKFYIGRAKENNA